MFSDTICRSYEISSTLDRLAVGDSLFCRDCIQCLVETYLWPASKCDL